MPTDFTFFDAAAAGQLVTGAFGVMTDNFSGVALILGPMIGIGIAGALINGAVKGKVRTGRK